MDRINIRVSNFKNYQIFKSWCTTYYPKIFEEQSLEIRQYTEAKFKNAKKKLADKKMKEYESEWNRIAPDGSIESAVTFLVESEGYTEERALEYANEVFKNSKKSLSEVILETTLPIFETTAETRKTLKWRCPIRFVRNFLYANWNLHDCFIYKWFFKGKKEFGQ